MVLTLDDMGPGWLRGIAGSAGQAQVYSSSHVQYTKGTSFSPVVQNTVAVYRSVAAAQNAYEAERPTTASVSNPGIGDESFLNDSVPIDKKLVFRKDNVVVWVWLQNDKTEDPVHYAQIIEPRITP
jgi:hypothetical protein